MMQGSTIIYGILLALSASATLGIPGGWSNADVNSEAIQGIAKFVTEELEKESNSAYPSNLQSVLKAETQIVSGIRYRLTLVLAEYDCFRHEHKDLESCNVQRTQTCEVEVWEQSWVNFRELTTFHCVYDNVGSKKDSRSRRSTVAVEKSVDLSDTLVRDAVSFAASHLQSESNGMYNVEFHRLITGTKQVVAGLYYRLDVEMKMSSCARSAESSTPLLLSDCADSPMKSVIKCYIEVLDQAWNTPRHTLKHHRCQPVTDSLETLYFESASQLIGGKHDLGGRDAFESFKQKHGKQYNSAEEEAKRFAIFSSNMKLAKKIEALDQGTAKYGASQFADLTPEEFQKMYLPRRWDMSHDDRLQQAEIPEDTPAAEFDWRQHNAVTEVKNQGSCGSCWAFSVTGNIEGQWYLNKKQLLSLSEQELVDCDKLDEGCNGGLPSNAYEEIQRLGGLESEADYPYEGVDEKCKFVQQDIRVYINGSLNISKDEEEMKAWIYKNGPTSIGINAFAMQFYLGGISHPWKVFCAPDFLDHGVLIVGYGVKKGWFGDTPYWIVKNSWGPSWGEKGYYLVYRGAGVCGLNQMVSSAIVK